MTFENICQAELASVSAKDQENVAQVDSVLQCVAVCCSVLQYVAVRCSVLQCGAVWCSVVQSVYQR